MADNTLSITLQVLAGELKSGLAEAGAAIKAWGAEVTETLDNISERAEGLKGIWHDLAEAFLAYEAVEVLKKIAEGASEASDAMEIAANTAKNLGNTESVEEMNAWLLKFAKSAQGGGYSIDEMRAALQSFASVGANVEQQQRLLADAVGLAAMRHLDLAEATRILTLAATGHVAILGRYGIETKDASGKTLDFTHVIQNLEKAMSGDAAIRANSLEGAFSRLGLSLKAITDGAFGQELASIFEGMANALARLLDAIAKIPAPVLQTVAALAAMSLGLVALNLAVGAAPLLWRAVIATFENLQAIAGLVGQVFGFVATGIGLVARGAAAAVAPLLGMASAEAASEVPLLAIVAGAAAVVIAIDLIVKHADALARGWQTVTSFLSTAWGEFVNNVLGSKDALLSFFKGIVDALNPTTISQGISELSLASALYMPKTTSALYGGIKTGIDSGISYAKSEWSKFASWITGIFGSTVGPGAGVPRADLGDLGGPEKAGKSKDGQKALNDALTQAKSEIQSALDAALLRVEEAKNAVDAAKANLDLFKANTPKITTVGEAQEEQQLITAEMAKQGQLKAALLNQERELQKAAAAELALARELPKSDKDRVAHAAELVKAANDHKLAAQRVGIEYTNIGVAIANLIKEMGEPMAELAKQAQALAEATADAAYKESQARIAGEREALRIAQATRARTRGENTPVSEAKATVADANLGVESAQADLTKATADLAAVEANATATTEDLKKAQDAVAEAQTKLTVAQHDAQLALTAYADAVRNSQLNLTNIIDQVAAGFAKLIPGLSVSQTASGGLSAMFNWMTLLGDVIQKTQAYKQIQSVVNQVLNVFAQILNALSPVIDTLLRAFEFFANIIIDVYNTFARLLGLLGIHLQLLSQLNMALDQTTAPLIAIQHSLPTLNELATGKVGTLSTTWQNVSPDNFLNPVTNALQSTSLGGGLFGGLLEIVGVLVAIKELLAVVGIGSGLNSGGGGLFGWIKNLFNFGGSGGSDAGQIGQESFGSWADDAADTMDTSDGALGMLLGPNAVASIDNSDGVIGALLGDSAATSDAGVADMADASFGSWGSSASGLSGILGALGGGLAGAGVGSLIAKLLGMGGDSSIGGTVGGAAGGIWGGALLSSLLGIKLGAFGGPLGMIAGGLLGTLIGSLFGPHTSPGQNPDMYPSTNYGQDIANLTGMAEIQDASGTYGADSETVAFMQAMGFGLNGGTQNRQSNGAMNASAGVDAVEKFLSSYSDTKLPPGVSKAQYDSWVSMFGTSGQGAFAWAPGSKNIGYEEVTGNTGTGGNEVFNYADAAAAMEQIEQLWSQGADTLGSINESFLGMLNGANVIMRTINATGNQLAGTVTPGKTASTTSTSTNSSNGSDSSNASVEIHNNISASGITSADAEAISAAQAEATQRVLRSRGYLVTR